MTAIPVFLTRGGTTFAGLSVFPPVPKKYIGFLSLETQTFEKKRTKMHTNEEGIFCIVIMIYLFLIHMLQVLEQDVDGLSLTHRAVISCHRSLSMDATVNNKDRQSEEIPSIQRPQQETKFGDKGFLKE
ncbi:uncharacterized protein [Acropora muricata]|uniref:uncharacterized protein isoform X2 n=1 Tax=Acropora muricata TaxID=159855 RepID=UPI0034E49CF3